DDKEEENLRFMSLRNDVAIISNTSPLEKRIVMIVDNAKIHKAKSEEQGMVLVYLPPSLFPRSESN
ncbi:MAG: hypothetical protein ABWW66_00300, partial [Archaeoglobaceae archaeon]